MTLEKWICFGRKGSRGFVLLWWGGGGAVLQLMEVPYPGVEWELQLLAYTTAHSNARSLNRWVRPGIKPTSSWILAGLITTEPQWELPDKVLFLDMLCLRWNDVGIINGRVLLVGDNILNWQTVGNIDPLIVIVLLFHKYFKAVTSCAAWLGKILYVTTIFW